MKAIRDRKETEIPKLLYLDQNQWVELEKVEYKETKNEEISEILSLLRSLVSTDKLIVPIDVNRLIETSHRTLSFTRERLSELMMELSKGYAVLPFLFVQEAEIRNYISRKLDPSFGLSEVNLRELLINQNAENLLAGTPRLVNKQTGEEAHQINKEIEKIISTSEFKANILSTPANRNSSFEQEHVLRAEEAREILRTMEDDRERKYYLITGDYQLLMRKIMETYKLTDDQEGQIPELEKLGYLLMLRMCLPKSIRSVSDRVSFMQEFPLYYIHRTLVSYRDRNLDRPIQSNDNIDIVGYIAPIVYFHYIVGEKYFMTLANQAKLDELFNTVLCKKLTEIKPHLESLLNT